MFGQLPQRIVLLRGPLRFTAVGFFRGTFFKSWIFFQLLAHHFFQFDSGKLQQLDRLLELRRHHQLLDELLNLSNLKRHS